MIGAIDDLTLCHLLHDVAEGIRVLQSRDGIELSESQIRERARNIVMGLVGNYRIESLEDELLRQPLHDDDRPMHAARDARLAAGAGSEAGG